MKKYILSTLALFLGAFSAQAAPNYWVDDPADCPRSWNSVNCGADYVCGVNSQTNFPNCSSIASLTPPAFTTTSNTLHAGTLGAGYLINCQATAVGTGPFCTNNGNYFCNRSSTCNGYYRDTVCMANVFAVGGGGAFTCSNSCQSGRLDCDGDVTVGNCAVVQNSTAYIVGSNNHYGTTCAAAQVQCNTGYLDCNASITGATSGVNTATGDGCEIRPGVTSYNSAANNTYSWSCGAVCMAGYYDCNGQGVGASDGCEIRANVTSLAPNSVVNASCVSVCTGNYLDCNGDLQTGGAGNGCEVLNGGTCTLSGLEGQVNGCFSGAAKCELSPTEFKTGLQSINATDDPFLWGTQYGSGKLIEMKNANNPLAKFTVDNEGDVGIGTDTPHESASLDIDSKKGVLFPRVTEAERDALNNGNPPVGLFVYNIDSNAFNFWNGTYWMPMGSMDSVLFPGTFLLDF
jgi:hypothetical protein